jgi:hypothetical protein
MRSAMNAAIAVAILAVCLACSRPPSYAPPPRISQDDPALVAARARHEAQARGEITQEHDEFRGSDTLQLFFWIHPNLRLALRSTSTIPGRISVVFLSTTTEWRYLRCHTVDASSDHEPFQLPPFEREGEVVRGHVNEQLFALLPVEDVERLSRATDIRFRLCSDVVTLTPAQVDSLRDYVRRLRSPVAAHGDASTTP